MTSKIGFIARLWYYFRTGYSIYLTFLLGALNTLIVVWYLAIREVPAVQSFFGHFIPFALLVTFTGVPLSIVLGWVHFKRSQIFSSEADIGVESNPYYYKLAPGYTREVFGPLYLELLVQLKRLVTAQGLAPPEELARIEDLEEKLRVLINGGSVGTPRRKM
jgi:hypothetical protein